jgi:putative transposase
MKKSKFTEQQIAFALQQAESGTQVTEVCRKMGIAEATFYRWKQLYGGLMPSEVKKLRQLEEENTRLRRVVADLTLDKEMLQEVIRRKYDACSGTRDDRLRACRVPGVDPQSLPSDSGMPRDVSLFPATRAGAPQTAHP